MPNACILEWNVFMPSMQNLETNHHSTAVRSTRTFPCLGETVSRTISGAETPIPDFGIVCRRSSTLTFLRAARGMHGNL